MRVTDSLILLRTFRYCPMTPKYSLHFFSNAWIDSQNRFLLCSQHTLENTPLYSSGSRLTLRTYYTTILTLKKRTPKDLSDTTNQSNSSSASEDVQQEPRFSNSRQTAIVRHKADSSTNPRKRNVKKWIVCRS